MSIVRAAVVQDNPIVFDREATLEKVRNLTKEAAGQAAMSGEEITIRVLLGRGGASEVGYRTLGGLESGGDRAGDAIGQVRRVNYNVLVGEKR